MPKAVLDSTVLVSALLTRAPGGASRDLLDLAAAGAFELFLSDDILEETARVLLTSQRNRRRYKYADTDVVSYCKELARVGTVVSDVPDLAGIVRDPNDDMIIACAAAADAGYLVTRDKDLLVLGRYGEVKIVAPESFLEFLRRRPDP